MFSVYLSCFVDLIPCPTDKYMFKVNNKEKKIHLRLFLKPIHDIVLVFLLLPSTIVRYFAPYDQHHEHIHDFYLSCSYMHNTIKIICIHNSWPAKKDFITLMEYNLISCYLDLRLSAFTTKVRQFLM